MLTSAQLKKIVAEARPLIEQQLDLTEQVAGLREVVTAAGGDWSQLKALVKAQIQDERDEAGDGKRVRKILDKADYAQGYADMLGLAKMNEKNSFADMTPEDREARRRMRLSEAMLDNKALSEQMLRDGLISAEAHAENVAISDGVARKLGAGVINPETGEVDDEPNSSDPGVAAKAEEPPPGPQHGSSANPIEERRDAASSASAERPAEASSAEPVDKTAAPIQPSESTATIESHAKASDGNAVTSTASAVSGEQGRAPLHDGSGEASRLSDGSGTVAFNSPHDEAHRADPESPFSVGSSNSEPQGVSAGEKPGTPVAAATGEAGDTLGYRRIGTYILASEPGLSLDAAGWRQIGEVKGRSWSCDSRPRVDKHPTLDKLLFERAA